MIEILVHVLIVLLVFGVVWYIIGLLTTFLPPPFLQIARAILLVILLIWLLRLLLPLAGVAVP